MPILLAFEPPEDDVLSIVFFITLIFWTSDLLVNFRSGYYKEGVAQLRFRAIAIHYVRHWFFIDSSMVSIDWITFAVKDAGDLQYVSSLRTLRLLRLARLIRLLKLKKIMETLEDRIQSEWLHISLDILKMLLTIVVLCHIVACSWFGISVQQNNAGWVKDFDVGNSGIGYQYTTSLHWSLTQFTPASMEIMPRTTEERVFTIFMILLGLLIFSSFISQITAAATRLRQLSSQRDKNLFMLRRFLRERNLPIPLQLRIKKYVAWAIAHQNEEVQEADVVLLKMLSVPLRMDLEYETAKPVLLQHPFFMRVAWVDVNALRHTVHSSLAWLSLSEGDVLFTAGRNSSRIFFVESGTLEYDRNSMARSMGVECDLDDEKLTQCEWCCEAALWTSWVHVGTLRASTMCKIACFDAHKFSEAAIGYETVCGLTSLYAQRYVEILNKKPHKALSDLSKQMGIDPFDYEQNSSFETTPSCESQQ
eukprot:gnl/MRDRNA2_/MRDRNA2_71453_c0_seq2.p1 gnl/MRDRNA2_/MRDRNA2_71453_c0~~gnl/MRDRNA2_/MRDRNA2_71453_c0_seq2.p1  ORF type:complete len:524 (+),score=77.61 gnl/MRDRNA2_/MRDRNA2_71453_c0_seq2:143-1573(+)